MTDLKSANLDLEIDKGGETIVRDGMKKGDVAVVTGCARGFGRAIARRLAREGARVAVWDVIEDEGAATAKMCCDAGGDVTFFRADMGDPESVQAAARATVEKYGAPFAVVNNAGINLRCPAIDHPVEMWTRTLNVNLIGSFVCGQAFAREMIRSGRGGVIVNLASGRAIEGAANSIAYAASKAGIIAMTKTQATEWARHKIRVNAIIPGVSETRQPLEAGGTLEELRERGKGIPLGRVGHPDDIAGMVAFLVSADAAYITGQGLAINGGRIMLP